MSDDPQWLKDAKARGLEIRESGVNQEALVASSATTGSAAPEGMKLSEAEFQQQVIDLAHQYGWRVAHFRKVRVQRAGGETYWETPVAADGKGFPDLLMAKPGRLVALELKVGKNRATPEQRVWLEQFVLAGVPAFVVYPADGPFLTALLSGSHALPALSSSADTEV